MATTPRIGSMVLSRASAPSTFTTTSRAFSTSIVVRAGRYRNTPEEPATPVRSNPLVGNRAFNREPPKKSSEPPKRSSEPITPPPPPPSPSSILSKMAAPASEVKEESKYPYTAAKPVDLASIIANKSISFASNVDLRPMARPQIRAKAVTGRTVFIKERISNTSAPTPTFAFRVLNKMLREQQVKTKFHSQRFHERKGLKRKRLASQRWRSRFKTGFKATVNRVLELKRQGW
ncbi:hypothetical protein B0T10DRAFT_546104 [Thelonectria olida]|uniref:Ribosomal protein S21 n=1 Tax=Thelonectria olida TaxID=1576542 RepID=A0A9P8WD93_9HYPO|nr:hypothetical protein B0T10DRAFT_546104 [Thelonectria olida]